MNSPARPMRAVHATQRARECAAARGAVHARPAYSARRPVAGGSRVRWRFCKRDLELLLNYN